MQERLRTLRASLGSSKLPSSQEAPISQQPKAVTGANPARQSSKTPCRRIGTPPAGLSPHRGALVLALNSPRAAGNSSEDAEQGPGAACSKSKGRLLECEAVQGLCQLLEHHIAVLEQSQKPLGSLLQSDPAQTSKQTCISIALLHSWSQPNWEGTHPQVYYLCFLRNRDL